MPIFCRFKNIFRFKRYSLKVKMLMVFITISVIPVVFTQVVSYKLSQYYLEKKITSLTNINMHYIKTNIETNMNYYRDTIFRLSADNDCLDLEEKFDFGNGFERATSINKIRDVFGTYSYTRSQIRAITFVSKDGRNVYYDKKGEGINNRVWDNYSNSQKAKIYKTIMKSNVPVILPTTKNKSIGDKSEYAFHIGLRIRSIMSKEELGVIIMSFNEQDLADLCNAERTVDRNKANICSLVVGTDGKIVSFENKEYIGYFVKEDLRGKAKSHKKVVTYKKLIGLPHNFSRNQLFINSTPINGTEWKVINIVNKDNLFYEVNVLRTLSIAFLAIIIVIVMIIIIIFSNKFYSSVKVIVKGMNEVKKGNFNTRIKLNTEDELAFIGEEFNEMSGKINNLVSDIKEQGEYILELSNKRREAEINAIVGQINPHFLYNTLDCISWMAIKKDQFEISDMIANLAQILRYGIGDINKEVSIYDEIQWLKKYISIQQVRFNNIFSLHLNVGDKVLGYRIHKLLLQPLVENSLVHGFKGYDSGRRLSVDITEIGEGYLSIRVEDNGGGISKEKLEEIIKNIEADKNEGTSIGIKNVHDRLKIYYGEEGKFKLESEQGEGTVITLTIPAIPTIA